MARPCNVCTHDARKEIDEALITRKSFCAVSRTFSIGRDALRRHTKEHLPALLAKAHAAGEIARADELIDKIKHLQERTERLLDKAELHGKWHSAFVGVGQYRQNLELLGRLIGELEATPAVQINVLMSDEWLELRSRIVAALEPHQEAREAVLRALELAPR
jgi:hypothetical protein